MVRMLADARVDFLPNYHRIGPAPDEILLHHTVASGSFTGPHVQLTVIPSCGAEWSAVRGDGVIAFESKQILHTAHGELVCASLSGLYDVGDDGYVDVLDDVLVSRVRAEFAIRFFTGANDYRWLNRELFMGEGERDFTLHRFEFQIFAR